MSKSGKQPRESNIELLRVILMIMIIFHHLIVHARGLKLLGEDDNFLITDHTISDGLIDSFLVMTVNCFVFISGYYGFKFKMKTLISLFVQTFMYSVLLIILYDYFFGKISLYTFSFSLFPVFKGYWWFITTYILLYMLSPLLNVVKLQLNRFQFLYILGVLTVAVSLIGFKWGTIYFGVNNGYSIISFITIYFYGYALKTYLILNRSKYFYIITYILSSLSIFLMFILGLKFFGPNSAYKAFAYNNPFVIIAAISFFFIFKESKVSSRIILRISPLVLGVYIIHDHNKSRILLEYICHKLELYEVNIYVSLLCLSLVIFFGTASIEWVRSRLTDPAIDFFVKRFKLDSLNEKVNV